MKKNKHINFIEFAFAYLGCFLGVGYVSGRELWEFFGSFGIMGYFGLLISTVLLLLFGIISVELVNLCKEKTIDEIITFKNNKFIKKFVTLITYSSMYTIFVIMTAGSGAIFENIFGINKIIGSIFFTLIIFISVLIGIYKVVKILTMIIPILVLISVFICKETLTTYSIIINYQNLNNNPLLSNWFSSAVIYLSTNVLVALGVLFTIGPLVKNRVHSITGSIITGTTLFLFGSIIILTLSTMQMSVNYDLPMLYNSAKLSDVYAIIYSLLLLFGMFSAAIGNTTTLTINIQEKLFSNKKYGMIVSASIICISGIIISNFGFTNLIKNVYPILGYFGLPIIFLIIFKYIYIKKHI